jgi:hypothetical protein
MVVYANFINISNILWRSIFDCWRNPEYRKTKPTDRPEKKPTDMLDEISDWSQKITDLHKLEHNDLLVAVHLTHTTGLCTATHILINCITQSKLSSINEKQNWYRRGRDRMLVWFTTTYAISKLKLWVQISMIGACTRCNIMW